MKVTCALEMLYQDAVRKRVPLPAARVSDIDADADSEQAQLERDLARLCVPSNAHWMRYRKALADMHWFGDFLVGSQPHQHLERQAQLGYRKAVESTLHAADSSKEDARDDGDDQSAPLAPDAAALMDSVLTAAALANSGAAAATHGFGYESEVVVEPARMLSALSASDSDAFMHLSPEQLEQLLSYVS